LQQGQIKYSKKIFTISRDYAEALKRKVDVFHKQSKTKKQLFLIMIAANGVTQNYHSEAIISDTVTLNDLFL
jgi:uncharacterized protein